MSTMSKEQTPNYKKYLIVLLLTIAIFVFGLLLGSYTSTHKLQDVRSLQDDLRTQTLDIETQYSLATEDPCAFAAAAPLTTELYELSTRLDFMENLLGPRDSRVLSLKKYYSILELRHWLFLKRLSDECGTDAVLVLYFYSNEAEACPSCEEQGFLLTWLRKNHPNVHVFSLEKDLAVGSVQAVQQRYGVTGTPFLVIGDEPLEGFQSQEALLSALQRHQ